MPVLTTQLNPRSADFQANAAQMQAAVDDLQVQIAKQAQEAVRAMVRGMGCSATALRHLLLSM